MKRRVGLYLLVLLTFVLLIKTDVSAARTKDGWEYKTDEYGRIEITGYYGDATKLEMPKEIDGKLVDKVMSHKVNWNNESVEELIIPKVIEKSMENNYFTTRLKNLKKVIISEGIDVIGNDIFQDCDRLEEVILPNSLKEIHNDAFRNCRSLRKINIGPNVNEIGDDDCVNPFRSCKNLSEITVDPTNKNFMVIEHALYARGGKELIFDLVQDGEKTYKVRDGVQVIYDGAIVSDQIEDIEISKSVVRLYEFELECPGVLNINVDEKNPVYCSEEGILYSKSKKILKKYPRGRLGSFTAPDGVFRIAGGAFMGTKSNYIELPDTVKEIEKNAFYKTKNLTELKLSGNVESYDGSVINECGIKKLIFPNGTKRISQFACLNCPNLKEVVIPKSLTAIEFRNGITTDFSYMRAFPGCTNIEKFTVTKGNKAYYSKGGVMYEKKDKQLLIYPPAKKGQTFVLQERQELKFGPFYDTKYLKKVIFKKGFYADDATYAFVNCMGLMIVTTDDSVLESYKKDFMYKSQKCYLLVHKRSNVLKQAKDYGIPYKLKK